MSVVVQGADVRLREDLGTDVSPARIPGAIRFEWHAELLREGCLREAQCLATLTNRQRGQRRPDVEPRYRSTTLPCKSREVKVGPLAAYVRCRVPRRLACLNARRHVRQRRYVLARLEPRLPGRRQQLTVAVRQ